MLNEFEISQIVVPDKTASVICWWIVQTIWTQIRPNKMSENVKLFDLWNNFLREKTTTKTADAKKGMNNPACIELKLQSLQLLIYFFFRKHLKRKHVLWKIIIIADLVTLRICSKVYIYIVGTHCSIKSISALCMLGNFSHIFVVARFLFQNFGFRWSPTFCRAWMVGPNCLQRLNSFISAASYICTLAAAKKLGAHYNTDLDRTCSKASGSKFQKSR